MQPGVFEIIRPAYRVKNSTSFQQLRLQIPCGDNFYYWMSWFSRADRINAADVSRAAPRVRPAKSRNGRKALAITAASRIWEKKETRYEFGPDGFECWLKLRGRGALDRVYFFSGLLQDMVTGSIPGFDWFYPGCPNFLGRRLFSPSEPFSIHAGYETIHWGPALNSGPLFYAFQKEGCNRCFSVGLAAQPGENQFQCFDFNFKSPEALATLDQVVNTQSFSLGYFGALEINGEWESPHLVFQFGKDPEDCLQKYCRLLEQRGAIARRARRRRPAWWTRPIFCGWHEQVAVALMRAEKNGLSKQEVETGGSIMNTCTQANYRKWLDRLQREKIPVGTVIIDAKWQKTFGGFAVDTQKWPDMRGFIDACHAQGLKVMLWIQAWSREGLDAAECLRKDGAPAAPDPTQPAYRRRLEDGVEYMLSPRAGCLNADGLKIDGTVGIPAGYGVKTRGGVYGFELQHCYLNLVYQKAREVKRDALISVYIANPYFRDVCNMVRAGDLYSVYGRPVDTLQARARVMAIAMADKPLDTDGTFRFSMDEDFLKEMRAQIKVGVPAIYQAETLCQRRTFCQTVFRRLQPADYRRLRALLTDD